MHLTVIGSDFMLFHTVNIDGSFAYLMAQSVAYLLYPLLGWLADVYFTRYKFILSSFITTMVATIIMIVVSVLFMNFPDARPLFYLGGVSIIIGLIGLGMFESTAIQFGMDQMPEASSNQLSTFIQWYYWSCTVGQAIIILVTTGIIEFYSNCIIELNTTGSDHVDIYKLLHPYYFTITDTAILFMAGMQLICVFAGLCVFLCSKKHFKIDQTGNNPLKLIYQVLKYARHHKCPENRSAFTYWEEDIPSRIDLGKNKYGGPFTTEEVEDTKTFFSILFLLFSLFGFPFSGHGYSILDQLMKNQCPTEGIMLFLVDPMLLTSVVIVVVLPVYQLTKLCCHKYHPNMLKRMGLGLLCCFLNEAIDVVIQVTFMSSNNGLTNCTHFDKNVIDSCYFLSSELNINNACTTISNFTDNRFHCHNNDTPFLLVLIPNLLQSFSFLLVFMTALEFICAQAPLRLKGLLIGIWYALLAFNYFVEIIENYTVEDLSWKVFHSVKAGLILVSFLVYLCVSRRYSYRLRDEVVHEQYLVEDVYDRELDLAEKYEKENASAEDCSLVVESIDEKKCYGTAHAM